jgi:transposase
VQLTGAPHGSVSPGKLSILSNMKTAIDKVGRGEERDVNVRFMAMACHYVFEPEFCNPASGWEEGKVEKNVQDARHRFFQSAPRFPSLEALNDWLEQRCKEFWAKTPHGQNARHNIVETVPCLVNWTIFPFQLDGA